ncbi:MAG: NAD-dependent epimerase/dehydratase family protein [Bacteroidota bacterium]
MQTILGSGGAIGIELAKALKNYTDKIRLVSRNPEKVNENDELFSADLLIPGEVKNAVKGSTIVYVTVGFPYNYKIWKENWPKFIKNVIESCIENKCKLVFFDNIYMYDQNFLNGMTEETPINPSSKKGKIRADISAMILNKVKEGKLTALIARSADFYGPGIKNTSMLTETVFDPLSKGKKANWMSSLKFKHSFTYTPDAGKATALLGNSESAYNQIWHLPTAENSLTGKEWIDSAANAMGVKPKYQVATKFIVKLLGLFIPIMREMPEMMYQYDRDYVFNSDKFLQHFDMNPTPYFEGIKEIIKLDYKK